MPSISAADIWGTPKTDVGGGAALPPSDAYDRERGANIGQLQGEMAQYKPTDSRYGILQEELGNEQKLMDPAAKAGALETRAQYDRAEKGAAPQAKPTGFSAEEIWGAPKPAAKADPSWWDSLFGESKSAAPRSAKDQRMDAAYGTLGFSPGENLKQSLNQPFEAVQKAGLVGTLKQVGYNALGDVAAIADMFASVPGTLMHELMRTTARGTAMALGEPNKIGADMAKAIADDLVPDAWMSPVMSIAKYLTRDGGDIHSGIEQTMGLVTEASDKGFEWLSEKTGGVIQPGDFDSILKIFMASAGVHGGKAAITKAIGDKYEAQISKQGATAKKDWKSIAEAERDEQGKVKVKATEEAGAKQPDAKEGGTKNKPNAVWRGPEVDEPVEIVERDVGESDGRKYTKVRNREGGISMVPSDELFAEGAAREPKAATAPGEPVVAEKGKKGKKGKKFTDKLVKVHLKDGTEKWLLIHIEVQGEHEADFGQRMFKYFYRIYDKHDIDITALAVLTYKTDQRYDFNYDVYGTTHTYRYNIACIANYSEAELQSNENPFALICLAVQYDNSYRTDEDKKFSLKRGMIKMLRGRGYKKEEIIEFRHRKQVLFSVYN